MPYDNVPKEMWPKMDRCVRDVMRRAKAKGKKGKRMKKANAVAICYNSIVGKEMPMADAEKDATPTDTAEPEVEEAENKDLAEVATEDCHCALPVTFAELDVQQEAQEKVWAIQDVTYQFQNLMRNIFDNPQVEDKPAAIKALSDEYAVRLEEARNYEKKEVSFWEDPVAFVKAKISTAGKNDLPDEAFAYIAPGGKKVDGKTEPRSLRHYPVHDAAHARNAWARAQAQIKGGGEGAAIARKALPKIRAACKKFGIDISEKEYAMVSKSAEIFKDEDGKFRWIGFATNQFEDRQGDILTEAAHKEFVSFLDENPDMAPWFCPWHTLALARKNRADVWDYIDGFMMFSGPLEPEEAEQLARSKEKYDLGMSHMFYALERDEKNPKHILKYRSLEVSDLPVEFAANAWTPLDVPSDVPSKEAQMKIKANKRAYLVTQLGEDKVAEIERRAEKSREVLTALGIDSKDVEEVQDATPETEAEKKPDEKKPDETPDSAAAPAADAKAIVDEIIKNIDPAGLNAMLTSVVARLDALEAHQKELDGTVAEAKKEADEKVAEIVRPQAPTYLWSKRPSESKETEISTEDPLAKSNPKTGWLTNAYNGTPAQ